MLLADDGHEVTVLERDVEGPTDPSIAFERWERRGVNQFRLPHLLQARLRSLLEAELPRVLDGLAAAGALQMNLFTQIPDEMTGPKEPADGRFAMITGRRPLVEAVFAAAAGETPRVAIRRGVAVAGLDLLGTGASPPHVGGAVLDSRQTIEADLVIDAGGRRSPLPRWLADIGARPPKRSWRSPASATTAGTSARPTAPCRRCPGRPSRSTEACRSGCSRQTTGRGPSPSSRRPRMWRRGAYATSTRGRPPSGRSRWPPTGSTRNPSKTAS